jgi:methyl-accepting chemotaxis protein
MEEASVRLQRAVDNAQTPLMMIDRNFVVTYVNQATLGLLRKYEAIFRTLFPGFAADKVVGACIDSFHKNPAHQRSLLADPSRCPYETDIQAGPLKFHLVINAIIDTAGKHVGNTLEWSDVTEARKKETEIARMQSAVQGASTPLVMIDRDFVINYANQATVELLTKHEGTLRQIFPGFAVSKVLGTCIDTFHKNPAHQRRMLEDPRNLPHRADIQVGPLIFSITVGAITDSEGQYIGNTLEWSDVTAQRDAQRQIEKLIQGASSGKLSERIDASRYDGFMRDLATGMNRTLDAVVNPIHSAMEVIRALEGGDLTHEMQGEFDGDFAQLRDAMNTTVGNLKRMVGEIRESTSKISEGSGQIKEGNADLNKRTQSQAASLEECAATVEELTSTVKQNAENSRQASQLAAAARELAERGGEVVGSAVTAMGEINQASKKIADIIGVIDEIAFQTNLLALNAAVEAARAGEQGRGFAVVASEVRNLAGRSAAAAKEIKALIKDSVEKVEGGTKLVDESGKTLEEIVAGVKKSSDIIAEIAAASEEQASGIEQVSKAVMQMDEMTQQNAALVEEAAAASEAMDAQATGLTELIGFFTVDDAAEPAPARAAARPAPKPAAPAAKPAPKAPAAAAARAPAAKRPATTAAASAPAKAAAARAKSNDSEWEEF